MTKKLVDYADVKNKLVRSIPTNGMIGADPELFLTRNGRVIGSEKVIKETDRVVEDGVQVELHPAAHNCRESLMLNIQGCVRQLRDMVVPAKARTSLDVTVEVTKSQYNSLSDKNKQFGCGRSYNVHNTDFEVTKIDPSIYLKRSAGGHIHLGKDYLSTSESDAIRDPFKLVPILDILVGNTMVLLDRDPGNVERRKYYGMSGEYRMPEHGLEYRTLSNFWLRGTPLMSLVFGLARQAIATASNGNAEHLLSLVDMDDIIKAINENDFNLAKQNYDRYKHFIVDTSVAGYPVFTLQDEQELLDFEYLVERGLDSYFSKDIIEAWTTNPYASMGGWRTFMSNKLRPDRERAETRGAANKQCDGSKTTRAKTYA